MGQKPIDFIFKKTWSQLGFVIILIIIFLSVTLTFSARYMNLTLVQLPSRILKL